MEAERLGPFGGRLDQNRCRAEGIARPKLHETCKELAAWRIGFILTEGAESRAGALKARI